MEIQIYNPTQAQPLPPIQWNYNEVRQWVEDGLAAYKGRVYTEDTITEAKRDRAQLNKLADAIDTKRKEMKTLYLNPYQEFESQAKELTALIKGVSDEIGAQVKAYDECRKQEKLERIKTEMYAPMIGRLADLVPYESLHNPRWLNVTTSDTEISQELGGKIERIEAGLKAIDALDMDEAMAEQVKGKFLQTYDLATALAEKERIERQREELERYRQAQEAAAQAREQERKYTHPEPETPTPARHDSDSTEEEVHTVTFRIHVTRAQLQRLGEFMRANGIRPERV